MIIFHNASPMSVEDGRALFARADAVLPMVFIGETTARPAQDGDLDFFESGDDVIANAAPVRNCAVFADPKTLVDASAEMFGKLAVDVAVNRCAGLIRVNDELGLGRGICR